MTQAKLPTIGTAIFDRATGLVLNEWYRFFEDTYVRTGEDVDRIEIAVVAAESAAAAAIAAAALAASKADQSLVLTAGNGLTGGGDLSADRTFDALQDTGWTAGTGTPLKAAWAAYVGQTVSVGYVQAEAQATDNALKTLASRVLALEQALRANEGIDG